MLPGNELAVGIQSKSVRGLGSQPGGECEEQSHPRTGGFGGRCSPNPRNVWNFFFPNFVFAPKFDEFFFPFSQNLLKCILIQSRPKIVAVIFIVVYYCGLSSKNFQHKIEIRIAKISKLFFSQVSEHCTFFWTKNPINWPLWRGVIAGGSASFEAHNFFCKSLKTFFRKTSFFQS